jgi:hypothetical protein
MSNFMQRQVTGLENWLRVETKHGTEFVRIADVTLFVRDSETVTHPMSDEDRDATIEKDSSVCRRQARIMGERQGLWCPPVCSWLSRLHGVVCLRH